jgi:hypothetical protein
MTAIGLPFPSWFFDAVFSVGFGGTKILFRYGQFLEDRCKSPQRAQIGAPDGRI